MYEVVLRLEFPVEVEIVGFADDVSLEVYSESIEEVELITTHSIKVAKAWVRFRKLELAHRKTEVPVVNYRKWERVASGDQCRRLHNHIEALRQIFGGDD